MTESTAETTIALDRASVRRFDQDGHLFIDVANISAACVSPYRCEEIPEWTSLGLKAGEVYQLYRDADALAESAQSFCGKPLLFRHRPVNAEDHPHDIVVGAIGNDVRFEDPFLKASLSIWSREAIDVIESGEQSDLSCGYYYQCVMEPGIYKGTAYQGKMLAIKGNHCALVSEGRVPGAYVGDSALPLITEPIAAIPEATPAEIPDVVPVTPPEIVPETNIQVNEDLTQMATRQAALSRQALYASGAIRAYLLPKLAADMKLDITPALKSVTAKNWKASKPKIKTALDKALDGKLAQDADISDIIEMLDQLEEMTDGDVAAAAVDADPDDDDDEETKKKKAKEAAEKLKEAAAEDEDDDSAMDEDDDDDDDEETKKRKAKEAAEKLKEAADKKGAKDRKGARDADPEAGKEPTVKKSAMDAAIASAIKTASRNAEINTIARLRAIHEAEKIVRPYIGELAVAQDSAEAVFKLALDAAEVDLEGVPTAAYHAMVKMLPLPGEVKPVKVARVALDSAAHSDYLKRFPGVTALKTR